MNRKKHEEQKDGILEPVAPTPSVSEEDGDSSDSTDRELRQIVETGSITVDKRGHYIHCLTVIGQIEGHYVLPAQNKTTKYEHVIPQLVAIEESRDIEGLLIILNTVGGDIEAGLAIAELIAGMKTPTVSLVLGGGHSIGVPLAASSAYSFIAPSATMTVHPVRMTGLALGVPQTMSYFEQMQERIVRFVADNSRISADRFRSLMLATGQLVMDVGTVLDGEAAVKALLCGAAAVEVCTAIHQKGFEVIAEMNEYIDRWSERQGFGSLDEFRGRLNFKNDTSAMFQRVQYMKYFPSEAK